LAAAFGLPRLITLGVMASRSMVAEAVYAATAQSGASFAGRATTTGTVTMTPGGLLYTAGPADRLVVRAGAEVNEFEGIEAEGGGQSSTAAGWLASPHRLKYLHRIPGQSEATIEESFNGRTFESHVAGWTTIQGQRYDVNVSANGQTAGVRESDGQQYETTYRLTGAIKGGNVDLDVQEDNVEQFASTYSLALLYSQRGYASQFQSAVANTLRTGGDTFTFSNVHVESGAKEKGGQSSSGLTAVSGALLRNGQPFGTLTLQDGRPVAIAGQSSIPLDLVSTAR
jgi:hypothetical protein